MGFIGRTESGGSRRKTEGRAVTPLYASVCLWCLLFFTPLSFKACCPGRSETDQFLLHEAAEKSLIQDGNADDTFNHSSVCCTLAWAGLQMLFLSYMSLLSRVNICTSVCGCGHDD